MTLTKYRTLHNIMLVSSTIFRIFLLCGHFVHHTLYTETGKSLEIFIFVI
jgi:hypothetical protein